MDNIDTSKVVKMNLPIIINVIFFRENSIFRTKFEVAETRFIKFGLEAKWASDLKVRRPKEKSRGIDTDDEGLVRSLIFFLLIGWSISITVFLPELDWSSSRILKILQSIILKELNYENFKN